MNGYRDSKYDDILSQNWQLILNGIFGTSTPIEVGAAMAFARYLSHVGVTPKNYLLFLRIIESNNKWIVDELVGNRDPRLLFSVIRPNADLIGRVMELLASWHPGQIYSKVLLSVLGAVEYTFHKPDDGYEIYRLSITDLCNIGKFLDERDDQSSDVNRPVLGILDRIAQLGEYGISREKSVLSRQAYNIRSAFFDNTKSLVDTIPSVLLVRLDREELEVPPSKEYIDVFGKIADDK